MVRKTLYCYLFCFVISSILDIKLAFWFVLIGFVLSPFYYKYKNEKKESEEKIIEQSCKRTETICANIVEIENECSWGEYTYWVICEYWCRGEKFIFRSMPVTYELNLSVGQEIEVMVEPDDYTNYYVRLNDYIILPEQREGVKVGKMYFISENMWGKSKEKQVFIGILLIALWGCLMAMWLFFQKGLINLEEIRVIGLLLCVLLVITRKKVGW